MQDVDQRSDIRQAGGAGLSVSAMIAVVVSSRYGSRFTATGFIMIIWRYD
ncbi:hypothetical protein [Nocardia sp. NPDC051832]